MNASICLGAAAVISALLFFYSLSRIYILGRWKLWLAFHPFARSKKPGLDFCKASNRKWRIIAVCSTVTCVVSFLLFILRTTLP